MNLEPLVRKDLLSALRSFDTCVVSNAIETFEVRLRNVGFADSRIRCMFEDAPPLVGYAATARLRAGEPPMSGRIYHDRTEWWNSILQIPEPRIVVLQDMDEPPGVGAFLGDMHAAILQGLGCVGYVTNGAVRELPRIRGLDFQLFAGSVAVSHAYAHIFDFGHAVKIGGLEVMSSDLLHGDRHGILTIPAEIAAKVPEVAARLQQTAQRIIDFCRSKEFSVSQLRSMMRELN
jgi:regulator of RNase E activity RraA